MRRELRQRLSQCVASLGELAGVLRGSAEASADANWETADCVQAEIAQVVRELEDACAMLKRAAPPDVSTVGKVLRHGKREPRRGRAR